MLPACVWKIGRFYVVKIWSAHRASGLAPNNGSACSPRSGQLRRKLSTRDVSGTQLICLGAKRGRAPVTLVPLAFTSPAPALLSSVIFSLLVYWSEIYPCNPQRFYCYETNNIICR